ncbi:LLM class flavin-dependent oxidoreductase, partial [Streptomyces sp. NPDC059627]
MANQHLPAVTFGIKTTPMRVPYEDILRVWQEADELPEIADAWLWDHLMPIAGPKDGQILEGWTLLSALAARTQRLRRGVRVTTTRLRPPPLRPQKAPTNDEMSRG